MLQARLGRWGLLPALPLEGESVGAEVVSRLGSRELLVVLDLCGPPRVDLPLAPVHPVTEAQLLAVHGARALGGKEGDVLDRRESLRQGLLVGRERGRVLRFGARVVSRRVDSVVLRDLLERVLRMVSEVSVLVLEEIAVLSRVVPPYHKIDVPLVLCVDVGRLAVRWVILLPNLIL